MTNDHISSDYSSVASSMSSSSSTSTSPSLSVLKEFCLLISDLRVVCKDLCNLAQQIDKITSKAEEKLSLLIEKFELSNKTQVQINETSNQDTKYTRSTSQPNFQHQQTAKFPLDPVYESLKPSVDNNASQVHSKKTPNLKLLKRSSMIESSFYEDKLDDELEKEMLKNHSLARSTSNETSSDPKEFKTKSNHVCFNLNNAIYTPKNDVPIPLNALKGTKIYENQVRRATTNGMKTQDPNDTLKRSNFGISKLIRKNSFPKDPSS